MRLGELPYLASVRPVVLITGFLGAGKTTLLRELLVAVAAESILADVILNDYADAKVDLLTLDGFARNLEPLTATCACCEGMDFLLELSLKSSQSDSDILFIELNGTADPVPIVETFTILDEKLRLHPRWQVCVVDVRHFGKRAAYSDIEELQLQTASHVYFSHVSGGDVDPLLIEYVRKINPTVSIVGREEVIEQVVDLAGISKRRLLGGGSDTVGLGVSRMDMGNQHMRAHEFTACKIMLPDSAPEARVREWLAKLPEGVIRAKVLIGIDEKPQYRYLLERVNMEVSKYIQKVTLDSVRVPNSAILIGPDINPGELEKVFVL